MVINIRLLLILAAILVGFRQVAFAQQDAPADDVSARYQNYLRQVQNSMTGSRGMPNPEVMAHLKVLRDLSINSDSALSRVITALYPARNPDSTAVIFYTFQDDVLTSVLFIPSAPFEKVSRPITRSQLDRLHSNVVQALGMSNLLANRAPRLRGAVPVPVKTASSLSLDDALAEATRVLLPFRTPFARIKHVIFIPAYNVSVFPLSLLRPFGTQEHLISKCSYSIAPSLADFLTSRQLVLMRSWSRESSGLLNDPLAALKSRKATLRFTLEHPLFVANPQYPVGGRYFFPDLPGAEKEVSAVLSYATKTFTILRGKAAIKDSILRHLKYADVLYIASHGLSNAANPMDSSCLVLSGPDPFLSARQIQALRFRQKTMPELVVLSACQTGLGKSDDAGVVGLARAFLVAGTNDVVMSLWNVDDDATAYLMSRFMHHLLTEPYTYGPAEPLRKAMLDCWSKYPHPRYWASFAVAGMAY